MIATSLLVVPRSMPMMVSMGLSPSLRFEPGCAGSVVSRWFVGSVVSRWFVGSVVSRWFVGSGVRQGGVRFAIRFLVILVSLAANRPDLGQAEDAAPPGVSSPQLFDDDHPIGIDRSAQADDRLDGLRLQHLAHAVVDQVESLEQRLQPILVHPLGRAFDDFPHLPVVPPQEEAAEPRQARVHPIEGLTELAGGLLGRDNSGLLDLDAAAIERLIKGRQSLGDWLTGRPCRLFFPGCNRAKVLDRLAQRWQQGLGLLLQASRALGLQLQLLPQRREFLDQVDKTEWPARIMLGLLLED